MRIHYFLFRFLAILLFSTFSSFAQSTWNLVGQDNSTRCINVLSKLVNGKIYAPSFSINWNDTLSYTQISLTNLSFNGEFVFDSLYGNSNQTFALSATSFNSSYNQGEFCFAGDIRYPLNNYTKFGFLALDTLNNTKLLYTSPFNYDTTVSFYGISLVKKFGNKYFIASKLQHPSAYQWENDNWCGWSVLQMLDSLGNVLASKTIGGGVSQQNYIYTCNTVHYFDNHYYAIVNKLNYRQWQTNPTDLIVYKFDTLLNIVSSYSTSNGNWYASNSSSFYENGDFIVGGTYVDARDNNDDFWQRKYIRKFDKNLNVIWTKYFGRRNLNTYITKLMVTSDGNIAGCGIDGLVTTSVNGDSIGHITGCIFKFSLDGDSLWMHNYQAMDSPIYGDVNQLNDLDEMPDGGFIACGYGDEINNGNLKRGWIMRVGANGCLNPDCISSTKEADESNQYFVYPNPTNDILNITNPHQISTFQIYQMDGKLITQGITFPINIGDLKNGIYFLKITTKNKEIINHKILKN